MPCTYEETAAEKAAYQKKHDEQIRKAALRKYKKELSKLTQMLCSTLKAIEDLEYQNNVALTRHLPEEVLAWKEKHKKQDAQRGEPWHKK